MGDVVPFAPRKPAAPTLEDLCEDLCEDDVRVIEEAYRATFAAAERYERERRRERDLELRVAELMRENARLKGALARRQRRRSADPEA